MCRMVCYLGPPLTLAELLLDPEHGLAQQAHAPRYQTHGTMNADGFGAGWYDLARSQTPALYRRAAPIWSDRSFDGIARLVVSGAVLAAVRSATPPLPVHEFNTPPYASGPWLFAHNGAIDGFAGETGVTLRRLLPAARAAAIEGSTDSETLFAFVLAALDRGAGPAAALRDAIQTVETVASGRMTMLMTDGRRAVAVARGDSLFLRDAGDALTVASEPFGGDDDWMRIPDRSIVTAAPHDIHIGPLDEPDHATDAAKEFA